jgi:trehalose 6-phosphate phosphatase
MADFRTTSVPSLPAYDAGWAFFLDVDGTLLDHARSPDAVAVDPALPALLHALHKSAVGAVALVSGRALADVDELLSTHFLPAAGQHGIERRDAGGRMHLQTWGETLFRRAAEQLRTFSAARPGLLLEDKGYTLATHYRQAPELQEEVRGAVESALSLLGPAFEMQRGRMVFEIKPRGIDKGTAITDFMGEGPFAGRTPVFIGDDDTDEHGFRVVNQAGGISIKVGPGPSVARWRIDNPAAVRRWLEGWLAATSHREAAT